jgi:hypothetical protein
MGYDRCTSTRDFKFGINGEDGVNIEGVFTVKDEEKYYYDAFLSECELVAICQNLNSVLGDRVNRKVIWNEELEIYEYDK